MAKLNTFKIQFHSFENGNHELDFEVDDSFFSNFEESEIEHGNVRVGVLMNKDFRQLRFDIKLKGVIEVACDRCLDTYDQKIKSSYVLFGKFGEGNTEDELDVVWISSKESEVDLAKFIYEYIVLSLPLKRIHPVGKGGEPGCDPDMLKRLNDIVISPED